MVWFTIKQLCVRYQLNNPVCKTQQSIVGKTGMYRVYSKMAAAALNIEKKKKRWQLFSELELLISAHPLVFAYGAFKLFWT